MIILPINKPIIGGFGTDFCSGDTAETWKDRTELVRFVSLCAGLCYSMLCDGKSLHVNERVYMIVRVLAKAMYEL